MGRILTSTQSIPERKNGAAFVLFDLDQSDDNRVPDEPGDVVNVESLHQLRAMCFDGFDADFQELCDLFGGPTFGD